MGFYLVLELHREGSAPAACAAGLFSTLGSGCFAMVMAQIDKHTHRHMGDFTWGEKDPVKLFFFSLTAGFFLCNLLVHFFNIFFVNR